MTLEVARFLIFDFCPSRENLKLTFKDPKIPEKVQCQQYSPHVKSVGIAPGLTLSPIWGGGHMVPPWVHQPKAENRLGPEGQAFAAFIMT